ncbi:MAG: GNAT family N-acetyltransferase [Chitinophagales bacterium]
MLFTIETDRLKLGILNEGYASLVLDFHLRNRTYLKPWSAKRGEDYYTLEKQAVNLHLQSEDFKQGKGLRFHLFKKNHPEKIIGNVGISNIIRGVFWSCHLGYQIDKEERNQGLMTEALKEVIRYVFEELQLHRIEANIMPRNLPSIEVVKKLGFENEGYAKKYLKINDTWEDHYHFVLLNEAVE